MIVDEKIMRISLKPIHRGLYFELARKADKRQNVYFSYKDAMKLFSHHRYSKYIKTLEDSGLILKEYKYFKTKDGIIGRRNRFKILLFNPIDIPDEVFNKIGNLTLKEKGILLTLYLLKSNDGYVFTTIAELTALFDLSYGTLSAFVRVLEEIGFIKRDKFRLKIYQRYS